MYRYIKRLFDLFTALTLLLMSSPFLIIIIIILAIHFKGSPIFKQKRLGYKNVSFEIYKLKTMRDLFDEKGVPLPDIDRITKLGALIRKLSLDEIPQVINVFKGEMSFIGPRPLSVKNYPLYTPREILRQEVKPGITGLAQVNGRNHLAWDKRLELDVVYYENMSFSMDVKILIKTVKNVIMQKDIAVTPQFKSIIKSRTKVYR
ncbi:sugar transferase [uncultured Lacinutrix sp.]|uniref:sugar transferase n=1 Tax=uncultured Lacinutrix sp. TaxID=574032 RepID=UPI00261143D0|nr:sugar transferase [uncultured Lacinutrix sp.]